MQGAHHLPQIIVKQSPDRCPRCFRNLFDGSCNPIHYGAGKEGRMGKVAIVDQLGFVVVGVFGGEGGTERCGGKGGFGGEVGFGGEGEMRTESAPSIGMFDLW